MYNKSRIYLRLILYYFFKLFRITKII